MLSEILKDYFQEIPRWGEISFDIYRNFRQLVFIFHSESAEQVFRELVMTKFDHFL